MKVDWAKLVRELGTIADCGSEFGGSDVGTQAIEHILGAEFFEQAVERYISFEPGYELARSVLLRLRPWSGMNHCYTIFKNSTNSSKRSTAVELIRYIGDRRILPWLPEFLADEDETIQNLTMRIMDQLLFWKLVDDEEIKPILELALNHKRSHIREEAALFLSTEDENGQENVVIN